MNGFWIILIAAAVVADDLPKDRQYLYEEVIRHPEVERQSSQFGNNHPAESYQSGVIARPVSYTYFSPNYHEPTARHFQATLPSIRRESYPPAQSHPLQSAPQYKVTEAYHRQPLPNGRIAHNKAVHSYVAYGPSYTPKPEFNTRQVTQKTLRFPINAVLPQNFNYEDHPHSRLIQPVNTHTHNTPTRKPQEVVLTHTEDRNIGSSVESETNPLKELEETSDDADEVGEKFDERTGNFRIFGGDEEEEEDGDQAESYQTYKTGHGTLGGGKGEEHGGSQHEQNSSWKGHKGKKGYEKGHKHHEGKKGHHDKERDSGEFKESLNEEKKYENDEEYYGEHHKSEKGGKGKKYGEGGKRKKGHSTHGEHNIVKKDEFIKNTKFYDEDHGGGAHEEHGVFYGQHEEKKGAKKEGAHKEAKHKKKSSEKVGHHDKGHVDEAHSGHKSGSGGEVTYSHDSEYAGKKGAHSSKKW